MAITTIKSAGRYLKTVGAVFEGRNLIITPELLSYAKKHPEDERLQQSMELRILSLQRSVQKMYQKEYKTNSFNASELRILQNRIQNAKDAVIESVMRADRITVGTMRKFQTVTNQLMAYASAREDKDWWRGQTGAKLAAIMGNIAEIRDSKVVSKGDDMTRLLELAKKLDIPELKNVMSAYERFMDSNVASDQIYNAFVDMSHSLEQMFDDNGIKYEYHGGSGHGKEALMYELGDLLKDFHII